MVTNPKMDYFSNIMDADDKPDTLMWERKNAP